MKQLNGTTQDIHATEAGPMKKILILGATGFIGRNLTRYLAAQGRMEVYGTYFRSKPLNDPDIHMLHADLTNTQDVDRVISGMDIVVQAAAVTAGIKDVAQNPHVYITDNAVMNSLILRSAFDHGVGRVVLLSCTVMYHSSDTPLRECDFDANREIYPNYFGGAWNKVYFEKMCEFYSRLGRGKYTVMRHSNVYGPYDKYDMEKSHVFGATMTKVMAANGDRIIIWGTGEEGRDLLHVDDLVSCIALAIEKQTAPFELFNVGCGTVITVQKLVETMIACSGKQLAIEHDLTKPSNKTSFSLNCDKAKQLLGWEPRISLEAGIRGTMEWYKTHVLTG